MIAKLPDHVNVFLDTNYKQTIVGIVIPWSLQTISGSIIQK